MNAVAFILIVGGAAAVVLALVAAVTVWRDRIERRRRSARDVRIASWLRDGLTLREAIKGKRASGRTRDE